MILYRIERLHNWASDTNFVWFPFLWLKLRPEQELTFAHRMKMTLFFGLYFGLLNVVRQALLGDPGSVRALALSVAEATGFFFFWFNLVTAFFWNRRASRMR
jgi:hypothetical protein